MKRPINQRRMALLTGASIVVMAITAAAVMGMVVVPLLEMNTNEFLKNQSIFAELFPFAVIGWGIILLCDVLVSWGVYQFYREKHRIYALWAGGLRMVYSLILFMAILQLVDAQIVLHSEELNPTIFLQKVHSFHWIWQIGLIVFGVHLIVLARLVDEKRVLLRSISICLFVGGIGYVVSNVGVLMYSNYASIRAGLELFFMPFMLLGELGFSIWLLRKGGKSLTPMKQQGAF